MGSQRVWIHPSQEISPYYILQLTLRDGTLVQSLVDPRSLHTDVRSELFALGPDEEYSFEFSLRVPEQEGVHELAVVYQNGKNLEVPGGSMWRGFIQSNRLVFRVSTPG